MQIKWLTRHNFSRINWSILCQTLVQSHRCLSWRIMRSEYMNFMNETKKMQILEHKLQSMHEFYSKVFRLHTCINVPTHSSIHTRKMVQWPKKKIIWITNVLPCEIWEQRIICLTILSHYTKLCTNKHQENYRSLYTD